MPPLARAATLSVLIALLAGCSNAVRYPSVPDDASSSDLNTLPAPIVMRLALARVAERHRPWTGPYAVDFPEPVNEGTRAGIARDLGPDAVAWDPAGANPPVLRVTRVWVLGDTATVDVTLPVEGIDARQAYTVRLRSSIQGWRVDGLRSWPVGVIPGPIPESRLGPQADADHEFPDVAIDLPC